MLYCHRFRFPTFCKNSSRPRGYAKDTFYESTDGCHSRSYDIESILTPSDDSWMLKKSKEISNENTLYRTLPISSLPSLGGKKNNKNKNIPESRVHFSDTINTRNRPHPSRFTHSSHRRIATEPPLTANSKPNTLQSSYTTNSFPLLAIPPDRIPTRRNKGFQNKPSRFSSKSTSSKSTSSLPPDVSPPLKSFSSILTTGLGRHRRTFDSIRGKFGDKTRTENDEGDVWVEITVAPLNKNVRKNGNTKNHHQKGARKENRLFYSAATGRACWNEPPSNAARVFFLGNSTESARSPLPPVVQSTIIKPTSRFRFRSGSISRSRSTMSRSRPSPTISKSRSTSTTSRSSTASSPSLSSAVVALSSSINQNNRTNFSSPGSYASAVTTSTAATQVRRGWGETPSNELRISHTSHDYI